jgi:hypothetical protein
MVYNPDVTTAKPATPLKSKKIEVKRIQSNNDVVDIIENEGMGYAVMNYMDSSQIMDLELAELWDEAATALGALESYLRANSKYEY